MHHGSCTFFQFKTEVQPAGVFTPPVVVTLMVDAACVAVAILLDRRMSPVAILPTVGVYGSSNLRKCQPSRPHILQCDPLSVFPAHHSIVTVVGISRLRKRVNHLTDRAASTSGTCASSYTDKLVVVIWSSSTFTVEVDYVQDLCSFCDSNFQGCSIELLQHYFCSTNLA